jgi:hypothetical protein
MKSDAMVKAERKKAVERFREKLFSKPKMEPCSTEETSNAAVRKTTGSLDDSFRSSRHVPEDSAHIIRHEPENFETKLQSLKQPIDEEWSASQAIDPGNDPRFTRRPSSFFKAGRVFAIMYHNEFSGQSTASGHQAGSTSQSRDHNSVRRMIIVKTGNGYSVCVPISTYSRKGLSKVRTGEIDKHAIIHGMGSSPTYLPGEPRSTKQPIEITLHSRDQQRLDPASRVNFGRAHRIK